MGFDLLRYSDCLSLLSEARNLGLRKEGFNKLSLYCHQFVMDGKLHNRETGEKESIALRRPEYLIFYIKNYGRIWRGNQSKQVRVVDTEQALEFCERHFDILNKSNFRGVNMRLYLREMLALIENDIKIDSTEHKERLTALIKRDKSLMGEGLAEKEFQEQLKKQAERELIDHLKTHQSIK